MKKILFSFAFMLIGLCAFANNEMSNKKSAIFSQIRRVESKNLEFNSFSEMLKKGVSRIVKIKEINCEFYFLDDCGNWYIVRYDSCYYTPLTAMIEASWMIYEETGC